MKPSEWMSCIVTMSEDEVVKIMAEDSGLADLPIQVECGSNETEDMCECITKFELLHPADISANPNFWIDYVDTVSKGFCPHFQHTAKIDKHAKSKMDKHETTKIETLYADLCIDQPTTSKMESFCINTVDQNATAKMDNRATTKMETHCTDTMDPLATARVDSSHVKTEDKHAATKMESVLNDSASLTSAEKVIKAKDEIDGNETVKTRVPDSKTATVYAAHLAVVLNKRKLLEIVLPETGEIEKNEELWNRLVTSYNMASPLHLALLHQNLDLYLYIIRQCTHLIHHIGLHLNTALSMASAEDDIKYLEAGVVECKGVKTDIYVYDLGNCLLSAVRSRAIKCIRYLINEGAVSFLEPKELLELTERCIFNNDLDVFKVIISDKKVDDLSEVLLQTIEQDKPTFAEKIIEVATSNKDIVDVNVSGPSERKRKPLLKDGIKYTIYSMILGSEGVTQILLKPDFVKDLYGAKSEVTDMMKWAVSLGRCDLEAQMMESRPDLERVDEVYVDPPILGAVRLNFRPLTCIKKLIERGFSVNKTNINDESPFNTAALQSMMGRSMSQRYEVIRLLLRNGADPFQGKENTNLFGVNEGVSYYQKERIFRLLYRLTLVPEILNVNTDISRSNLVDMLINNRHYSRNAINLLILILQNGFKIRDDQKEKLLQLLNKTDVPKQLANEIDIFLNSVKSLQILCRNSIRQFADWRLQTFLSLSNIPAPLKAFCSTSDTFSNCLLRTK